jgi:hypothetical protein
MEAHLRSLGWKEVEVIDEDLGRSAGGSVARTGFERMGAQVRGLRTRGLPVRAE